MNKIFGPVGMLLTLIALFVLAIPYFEKTSEVLAPVTETIQEKIKEEKDRQAVPTNASTTTTSENTLDAPH